MSLQPFVQRDEAVCEQRVRLLKGILTDVQTSSQTKYLKVVSAVDHWLEVDSDAKLLEGIPIPTSGPVVVNGKADTNNWAAVSLPRDTPVVAQVEPTANHEGHAEPAAGTVQQTAAAAASTANLDTAAKLKLIEANRKAALDRRDAMKRKAEETAEQFKTFEAQQWL